MELSRAAPSDFRKISDRLGMFSPPQSGLSRMGPHEPSEDPSSGPDIPLIGDYKFRSTLLKMTRQHHEWS